LFCDDEKKNGSSNFNVKSIFTPLNDNTNGITALQSSLPGFFVRLDVLENLFKSLNQWIYSENEDTRS
jgi:hypothetical protein